MTPGRGLTVINGPSLGELGGREPAHYGSLTLDRLESLIRSRADEAGVTVTFFQSDVEGEIVRAVNSASGASVGLIINPAAYSHYSIAIMDAMRAFRGPVVEVHLSRIFDRESFRRELVTASAADAFIAGAGSQGYLLALDILLELNSRKDGGTAIANQQ